MKTVIFRVVKIPNDEHTSENYSLGSQFEIEYNTVFEMLKQSKKITINNFIFQDDEILMFTHTIIKQYEKLLSIYKK